MPQSSDLQNPPPYVHPLLVKQIFRNAQEKVAATTVMAKQESQDPVSRLLGVFKNGMPLPIPYNAIHAIAVSSSNLLPLSIRPEIPRRSVGFEAWKGLKAIMSISDAR
jgi:hypothetical protein